MMALQTLAHSVGRAAGRARDEEDHAPVSIDLIHEGDAIVTRDGIPLGTVDGLYEGGRWHHHLLVVGPAAPHQQGTTAIYVIPLTRLAQHESRSRSFTLTASAGQAHHRWLIGVID